MKKPDFNQKIIDKILSLNHSAQWKDREQSYKLLKESASHFKNEYDIQRAWELIKNGLVDSDGRVRNTAYYALGNLRCNILFVFEESTFDLKILKDIYSLIKKEKDEKIKRSLYRGVIEMRSIMLEFKAKREGALEEYLKITNEAVQVTGRKRNQVSNEYADKIEQFARNISTFTELMEEQERKIMESYIPLKKLISAKNKVLIQNIEGREEEYSIILANAENSILSYFIANPETNDKEVLVALEEIRRDPLKDFDVTSDDNLLEFAIVYGLGVGMKEKKISEHELKLIFDWLIEEVKFHTKGGIEYLEMLEEAFKEIHENEGN